MTTAQKSAQRKIASLNTTKRCQNCEGRGVLYHGAPDALGTKTETCTRCNGKGKVIK